MGYINDIQMYGKHRKNQQHIVNMVYMGYINDR